LIFYFKKGKRIGHLLKTYVTNRMQTPHLNDEAIVAGIQGTAAERDRALQQFLRQHRDLRGQILHFVSLNRGNEQDGEDLFQDALVLFDRRIRRDGFEGKSSLATYFTSIARLHWIGKLRRKPDTQDLPERREDDSIEDPEADYLGEEKKAILTAALERIGEKCKKLLNLYKLDYSMEEIATELGISSAAMAKKDAYRCRMKLRDYLMERPDLLRQLGVHPPKKDAAGQ
jgi:RNA polymerase sigma factor (sigma-70 family)